jgi:hypothetical protein
MQPLLTILLQRPVTYSTFESLNKYKKINNQ